MGNDDELAMADFNAGNITGHLSKMCGLPVLFHSPGFDRAFKLGRAKWGAVGAARSCATLYVWSNM